MSDGRTIPPPRVGTSIGLVREIQSGREAQSTLQKIHRKLGDLPADGQKMNAIAAVMMYTSVGIADDDIAVALNTTVENVKRLKELDAYSQLSEMFDSTAFDDAKRTANHIISRAAASAAQRMVEAIDDQDPNIALVASRDVTKLAGIGTESESGRRIGGLNITIRRKGDRSDEDISISVGD